MSAAHDYAIEQVVFLRNVFPSDPFFTQLVEEGAHGGETYTLTGDDLAGACHAVQTLMDYLGVES